jgi:hypothetical protein
MIPNLAPHFTLNVTLELHELLSLHLDVKPETSQWLRGSCGLATL